MSERYAHAPESFGDNVGKDAAQSIDLDTLRDFEIAYKALEEQGETVNRQDIAQSTDEDLLPESLRASRELVEGAESISATYGPGYWDVVHAIETGIEKSKRGGYASLKVLADDGHEIPLGRYLAVDIYRYQAEGTLTPEGLRTVSDKYLAIAEANSSPKRPITTPINKVLWENPAGKHARDLESLKAGDFIDD